MTTSAPRPLRADAARNRDLLLAAAAAEFAEHGIDASIADIARRAGVGKGTVFRHFATKDHLLAAIVRSRLDVLATLGESLAGADDPEQALLEFLGVAIEQQQERDLSFLFAAAQTALAEPEVTRARERMFQAAYALVDRARAAGVLRADVTGPDVVLLMCAPGHVAEPLRAGSPELWRRYLGIIFDGLRPEGAHPLPQPPPTAPLPS
ncbi:AcrR family transcriptional regulator [Kitasatospora sp. GP30]|uniref:TetR/AcrR family transcriptional regulator n=1 Tax=Kitasatospora sp. GP30 TaxID=3035084 RepID=UPI000C705CFA|nr:TetR/AcrR family transcriptional regulator [Kitasatospora sp. GP30]MDH6140322.1 AcrR family transcriptional regulator [Kitasatospora sp. GP30]